MRSTRTHRGGTVWPDTSTPPGGMLLAIPWTGERAYRTNGMGERAYRKNGKPRRGRDAGQRMPFRNGPRGGAR